MSRALAIAAVGEMATGIALVVAPSLVSDALLGAALTGSAIPVARVAGMALVGLGIAGWPGPPLAGMLVYSTAVALYLGWLGLAGAATGVLLWPAMAAHVVLSGALAYEAMRSPRSNG